MARAPEFTDEQAEADFWDSHDSMDYTDGTVEVDSQLVDARPKKTAISLRLDPETVAKLKVIAQSKGIGYQTLIRLWVLERLQSEGK